MAVNQLQTLLNITGTLAGQSDPVSITENPLFTVTSPSLTSGGIVSTSAVKFEILAAADADCYVFIKNNGLTGGGAGNNVTDVTTKTTYGSPATEIHIASLNAGEFAFIPLKTGIGLILEYVSGADAEITYAFFTKG
tara:strand:- start:211 stop:621 length:411 start_codon:yes stop_codon:yes gene_type:complete